jgi:hypothetical protein
VSRTLALAACLCALVACGSSKASCPALSCTACPAGVKYDLQTHCATCECWPVCTLPKVTCSSTCGMPAQRDPTTGCETCECCNPADCVDGCPGAQDEHGCNACGPCS